MNTFIFQSVEERYDLRSKVVLAQKEAWYATRYRKQMQKDDIVYFWMGGDENLRGLYGWGHLIGSPYIKHEWKSHGVDIIYDVKFLKPLLARELMRISSLSSMLILRVPQATNFLLSDTESAALRDFVLASGEKAPENE